MIVEKSEALAALDNAWAAQNADSAAALMTEWTARVTSAWALVSLAASAQEIARGLFEIRDHLDGAPQWIASAIDDLREVTAR